jgi:hypothetical protein
MCTQWKGGSEEMGGAGGSLLECSLLTDITKNTSDYPYPCNQFCFEFIRTPPAFRYQYLGNPPMTRLFRLYSILQNIHPGKAGIEAVPIVWFVAKRPKPIVADYSEVVEQFDEGILRSSFDRYTSLNAADPAGDPLTYEQFVQHLLGFVEELFTQEEAELAAEYLDWFGHNIDETFAEEVALPLPFTSSSYRTLPAGPGDTFLLLSEREDYDLGFDILGYYKLTDLQEIDSSMGFPRFQDGDVLMNIGPRMAINYASRGKTYEDETTVTKLILDSSDYVRRGGERWLRCDLFGAFEDFGMAIHLNPHEASAYTNRGDLHRLFGRYPDAVEDYDMALKIDPMKSSAYVGRGTAKYELGDPFLAIEDLNRALQLSPGHFRAVLERGVANLIIGNWIGALRDSSRAIEMEPYDLRSRVLRARVYMNLGKYRYAIEDFGSAIRLQPESGWLFWEKAMAELELGDFEYTGDDMRSAHKIGLKTIVNSSRNIGKDA